MRRRLHLQFMLFSMLFFLPFTQLQATPGSNGTAEATVDNTNLTIGETVNLRVTVKGIGDGTARGADGTCKYTITIPDNILTGDLSELTDEEKSITETKTGAGGNGEFNYGPYSSLTPGIYTISLTGNVGENNQNPVVTFHPLAPEASPATEIGLEKFTANWNIATGASAYNVILSKSGEVIKTEEDIEDSFFEFTDLQPGTTYSYTVQSKAIDTESQQSILSLSESNSIEVTTDGALLGQEGLQNFENFTLGEEPAKQIITITGENLYGDISLSVTPEETFSINKSTIGMADEHKTLEITFNPVKAGTHNAELVLNSQYAAETRIQITGVAIPPAPEALAPSNEAISSFTAHWNSNDFAESYLLTVKNNSTHNIVAGYDNLPVGNVTNYNVTNLLSGSVYSYVVKAVNNGVNSVESNSIEATTISGAAISHGLLSDFEQQIFTSDEATIEIYGSDLTEDIALEISGDVEYFRLNQDEVDKEGGSVVLTYEPTELGNHIIKLKLSSTGADDVSFNIKGKSTPLRTTTLPATEITETSFTANWDEAAMASDYLLTVKLGESIIFENKSSEGATSLPVEDLTPGKIYTYTVKVKEKDQIFIDSDPVTVITHSAPVPRDYPERTAILIKWGEVPGVDSYKVVLTEDGQEPLSVDINTNEKLFTNLALNTTFTYKVIALFGTKEYESSEVFTKTISDYGDQSRNNGFENWENDGDAREPINWNSFWTAGGSFAGQAQTKKIREASAIRPGSSGEKSALIWSNEVMSVVANGNLTTGQIIAGSVSATDASKNFNKTVLNDPNFNTPFTGKPDSMTVWVKYVPVSAEGNKASITATIHDSYEYQDPPGGDKIDEIKSHEFSTAKRTFGAIANNDWERLSIPFVRNEDNKIDPEYILISFTTNETPGKGSKGDELYIDDILIIYNPSVSIGTPNKTKYLTGETLTIPFTLEGTMSASNLNAGPNMVYLELSDENGSFDSARRIAELKTDHSGEFEIKLPQDLVVSDNYKLRVVTTNYPMISTESVSFEIRTMPSIPDASDATNIKSSSFTANWAKVADATGYTLTIVEEMIGTSRDIEVAPTETSYEVTNLQPRTDYSFIVRARKNDLISDASNRIYLQTKDGGGITFTGETQFYTNGNTSTANTLSIQGIRLIENISVEFTENENEIFSIGTITELPAIGGEIEISYNPISIGTHTAKLVFKSESATDLQIDLTGTNSPKAVTASAATEVTPVSFTANWNTSDAAEAYILTVSDGNGAIEGYDGLNVGKVSSQAITGLNPATDYTYSVKVSAGGLMSDASNEIEQATAPKPEITDDIVIKKFEQTVNATDTDEFTVNATNLFGDNGINITLNGSEYFSIDKNEDVESGKSVTITYKPEAVGRDTVIITFSTPYADDLTIKAYGTSLPIAPIALDAEEVTFTSFVAKWETVEGAEAYLLTIKDSNGEVISGYDRFDAGTATSIEVTDLFKLRNYTYTVEVKIGELISAPSNEIAVRTVPSVGVDTYEAEILSLYPNPVQDRLFIRGTTAGKEYIIINTSGATVTKGIFNGDSIAVDQLEPNVYIIRIGNASYTFIKK